MSIYNNSTKINKLYAGTDLVNKAYAGTDLVYSGEYQFNFQYGGLGVVSGSWRSVVWSPEKNLFVGLFGGSVGSTYEKSIATSSDGITWALKSTPTIGNYTSLCWSKEKSLFVGLSYNESASGVIKSADATTWTTSTKPNTSGWNMVEWCSGFNLFVAVRYLGSTATTNAIITSPDATTWTGRGSTSSSNYTYFSKICYSPQLNKAIIYRSLATTNSLLVSTNGTSWSVKSIPDSSSCYIISMCWCSALNKFFGATNNKKILVSDDGETWTYLFEGTTPIVFGKIMWIDELGFFIGITSNKIMTSNDAITWREITYPSLTMYDIAYSPTLDRFVIIGSNSGISGTTSSILVST